MSAPVEWLARALGRPLVSGSERPAPADAIVVLGAPLAADGGVGPVVEERLRAGVALLRAGIAPLLCLSGGRTRGAEVAEAHAMAAWVRRAGVADERVIVESASATTYENARNLAEILLPRGARRVVVVTTPFHLRRAVRWFRRFGFAAEGYHMRDSLQYGDAGRALRWIRREYGSWVVMLAISAARGLRSRAGR